MKLFKKLSYILIAISGIWALTFALNYKQDSRAADFPENITLENNGSDFRGGAFS
ncbi:hypothetical protein [Xylocopilactobacillus apicola]|uniref:Uncharacterized protein n=1 Tax=Xylocopilactobacillus apicola TaxID=2932184 RepID=A0AAU9DSE2_9LACO|nr:hypothetical protein [Xylocopilactobacillus apicola]BDR58178.1 hypothetical protein XA3_06190 [Xylocopilactobacillus apicola]